MQHSDDVWSVEVIGRISGHSSSATNFLAIFSDQLKVQHTSLFIVLQINIIKIFLKMMLRISKLYEISLHFKYYLLNY